MITSWYPQQVGFPAIEVRTQLQLAFGWLGTGDLEPGKGKMEKEPTLGVQAKTGRPSRCRVDKLQPLHITKPSRYTLHT